MDLEGSNGSRDEWVCEGRRPVRVSTTEEVSGRSRLGPLVPSELSPSNLGKDPTSEKRKVPGRGGYGSGDRRVQGRGTGQEWNRR